MKKNKLKSFYSMTKFKGYLFLLPFFFGFIFYFAVIITKSLQYSFSENQMTISGFVSKFVGWENYKYAFTVDAKFNRMLTEAITSFLYNIPVIVIFSLFIAVVLNQKIKGRVVFRAIFFIPVVVATGLVAQVDMNNLLLSSLGSGEVYNGDIAGSSSQLFSMKNMEDFVMILGLSPSISEYIFNAVNNILSTINNSGVQILIFLSGLQSISPSIYESAQVEGASGWECFWKITFPMISPLILVNLFYSVIDYFTRTTSDMMTYLDNLIFMKSSYGVSTAMAWIYFACIGLILAVIALIINRFIHYQQK